MVHGDHRMVAAGGRLVKHRVRRPGAADLTAIDAGNHRRLDDAPFLVPEQPPFAGVGVESGHGDARAAQAEITAERVGGHLDAVAHRIRAEQTAHPAERFMDGDQHHPEPVAGHHHPHPRGAGQGGEHLGVAGVRVAGLAQTQLADGAGDHRTADTVHGQTNRRLDPAGHGPAGGGFGSAPGDRIAVERVGLVDRQGAGTNRVAGTPTDQLQGEAELLGRPPEHAQVADNDGWAVPVRVRSAEQATDDFRADARRAPHGHGQGPVVSLCGVAHNAPWLF